jgi:ATP diphosphatase
VAEELGDVLFQVVFYAQLGSERGLFSFQMIVDTLVRKLLRRHPHVFAGGDIEGVVSARASVESVKETWETIKQAERSARSQGAILADVPVALPALPRAQKLQKRAARVGFDWPDAGGVLAKLEEEIAELRRALACGTKTAVEEEVGDVLFSAVNLARHLELDAEATLRRASSKFEQRFAAMETLASAAGKSLQELSAGELDQLWEAAKRAGGDTP